MSLLRQADSHATVALKNYRAMDYQTSASDARQAYEDVLKALGRVRARFGNNVLPAPASTSQSGARDVKAPFDLVSRVGS